MERIEKIEIGTNRPSCNSKHLFKLFEIKILATIEPGLGNRTIYTRSSKSRACYRRCRKNYGKITVAWMILVYQNCWIVLQ